MLSMNLILILIPVLVNVAFFTLMERKILGLIQSRKGPNKVSVGGLMQPFSDAVKLFSKELTDLKAQSRWWFSFSPLGAIFLALAGWGLVSFNSRASGVLLGSIGTLVVLSMSLYPLFLMGWASHSSYANLGALRGVAQTISYEISLAIILLSLLFVCKSAGWMNVYHSFPQWPLMFLSWPAAFLWSVSVVAETNRTPFDFSEGESELVSGFNVEYGGGLFAVIFMAEYASILLLSALSVMMFSSQALGGAMAVLTCCGTFTWVWLRGTLPRYRYDKLMGLAWKSLLPLSLGLLILYSVL